MARHCPNPDIHDILRAHRQHTQARHEASGGRSNNVSFNNRGARVPRAAAPQLQSLCTPGSFARCSCPRSQTGSLPQASHRASPHTTTRPLPARAQGSTMAGHLATRQGHMCRRRVLAAGRLQEWVRAAQAHCSSCWGLPRNSMPARSTVRCAGCHSQLLELLATINCCQREALTLPSYTLPARLLMTSGAR